MKRNVEKYDYQVLNDAKNILMEIDMPKELYNPRCVMIFCACAQMIDGKSWRHISEEYMSVHDIIKYVNEVFPNKAGLVFPGFLFFGECCLALLWVSICSGWALPDG